MEPHDALARLGGVATLKELTQLVSRAKVRTAVRAGRVVKVRHGSYALPGVPPPDVLTRVGGVRSHLSAAQHWGWKVKHPPERPCVTVPRSYSGPRPDHVELHWGTLAPGALRDGVTSPVRTVIDCARAYDFDVALCVADSALRSGRVTKAQLIAAALASPRTGRGSALRVARAADGRAANPFESALRAIALEVPGLAVEPQQWVGEEGRADLLDRRLGLVIEADSFEFHSSREDLRRDVRRYTGFVRLGYAVIRFTWEDVMLRPGYVRRVLLDMVAWGPFPQAVRQHRAGGAA